MSVCACDAFWWEMTAMRKFIVKLVISLSRTKYCFFCYSNEIDLN